MTNELENPFDRNTLPYHHYQTMINVVEEKIPSEPITGQAGKYLRVKDDESGTEWADAAGGDDKVDKDTDESEDFKFGVKTIGTDKIPYILYE